MRKSLILTILLLIVSVCSLCYSHAWVDRQRDKVTIDETILCGNKGAAEGITIDYKTHYDYRLFWKTHYLISKTPAATTDFTFSQKQRRHNNNMDTSGIRFFTPLNGGQNTSSSGSIDLSNEIAPVKDVASRTESGETHTETVYLKDYYDFYPIDTAFNITQRLADNSDTRKFFTDYFHIPIYSNHKVTISINKNSNGDVYRIELSDFENSGVNFNTVSAMTESSCYFTLSCTTLDGKSLDTANLSNNYGIFQIKLQKDTINQPLSKEDIKMVFAIKPAQSKVVSLQLNTDKSKLLLVTFEDGDYMLTVIDINTMKAEQKLKILSVENEYTLRDLYIYKDFIVLVNDDGRLALLSLDEENRYRLQFVADMNENRNLKDAFNAFYANLAMDYNGERLAVAACTNTYDTSKNPNLVYLSIFDKAGLLYAGRYAYSLDRSIPNYSLACMPLDDTPLVVSW